MEQQVPPQTPAIKLYKRRTIGESLNATARFIRENRKVLLKYTLLLAVPLALLQVLFFPGTSMDVSSVLDGTYSSEGIFTSSAIAGLLSILTQVVMMAFAATLLKTYEEGRLLPTSTWKDFTHFAPFFGKTLNMMLRIFGVTVAVVVVIVLFATTAVRSDDGFTSIAPPGQILPLVMLLLLGLLVILPPLLLIWYPMYFEGTTVGKSFSKGFRLGWKHWGSTFVLMVMLYIIIYAIIYVFAIPQVLLEMSSLFGAGYEVSSMVYYFTAFLSAFGGTVAQPILIIGMAFHYGSCREKVEQVSTQASVDNFENL